jgi:hypothetical protein
MQIARRRPHGLDGCAAGTVQPYAPLVDFLSRAAQVAATVPGLLLSTHGL